MYAVRRAGSGGGAASAPAREPRRPWADASQQGRRLEAEHDHAAALAVYANAIFDGAHDAEIHAAMARCRLAIGHPSNAIAEARRALALDPTLVEASSVLTRGYLDERRYAEALEMADRWIALAPEAAGAHHARGRSLFGLARFAAARDAFDRACTLGPQLLEATMLRREADRAMRRIAEQVGTPHAITIDVPERLAGLRDALASGRVQEALAVLERPEYDCDGAAKLVQAECLAFDRRFDEAIAMYDRAAELSPQKRAHAVAGKVRALLALERAVDAMAELDRAQDLAQELAEVELVELRGLVLRRLGLEDEAQRELDRVIAASERGSDLRLGRQ